MKRRKIIILTILFSVTIAAGIYSINRIINTQSKSIKVLDYIKPDSITENGYEISKYEKVEAAGWIDSNKIFLLNPKEGTEKNKVSYISTYDLITKETKYYKDVSIAEMDFDGLSTSKKYALYGEPRNIPEINSKEYEEKLELEELFKTKKDILNLETGEIKQDFDSVVNNCSASYRWIDDDYIFVDYGSEWRVLDKQGSVLNSGFINYDSSCAVDSSVLFDVSDLKVQDNKLSGCFYYTKCFMGDDGSMGEKIYSMDIETKQERVLAKYEHGQNLIKQNQTIVGESFDNHGEANEAGVYENRTFNLDVFNTDGVLLKTLNLDKGRFCNTKKLSPDGKKLAFIERDYALDKNYVDSTNMAIKILDIETGDVKEIVNVGNLRDSIHEEDFESYVNRGKEFSNLSGPVISDIFWDDTGRSLMFNYKYVSNEEDNNYTNVYIVNFDK